MFREYSTTCLGRLRYGLTLCGIVLTIGLILEWRAWARPEEAGGSPAEQSLSRGLTIEERVTNQRAIEDVYWRHRIWPKENPQPKPGLETVMPETALRAKVEDYLQKSQALEIFWQRPITSEQLQAEMERMARQTRRAEMLAELLAALDNDPYLIAECLARPALANRLIRNYFAGDDPARRDDAQKAQFEMWWGEVRGAIRSEIQEPSVNYRLPAISSGSTECMDDTWTATDATTAPAPRTGHTAVWTGSEMIIWGGYRVPTRFNSGGRYDPATDSWMETSLKNVPMGRSGHTAVWTGLEMIIWGGGFHTGGRYSPATDSWEATSLRGAPNARFHHTAVWTGREMIVWGGSLGESPVVPGGGRYDPAKDSWAAVTTSGGPSPRFYHTAVWAKNEMIIWGGHSQMGVFRTGGRYDPDKDRWQATTVTNAPSARTLHTAVWTGDEMIVWGGGFSNTGGRYDPSTDSWRETNVSEAPTARSGHTAVWTDREMIIWGVSGNTGGRYDPSTDSWMATSTTDAPTGRSAHTAVWAESEMIVWGGYVGSPTNTGGRYCASTAPPK